MNTLQAYAIRISPGGFLKESLEKDFLDRASTAGCIVSCVGSLRKARIRFAGESQTQVLEGPFEILGLVGTLAKDGAHLHITLADKTGRVIGGHVLPECEVYTTAEVVWGALPALHFHREVDSETGHRELVIT